MSGMPLSFVEPRGSSDLHFDNPDGTEWGGLGSFLSGLYDSPKGSGDGGGTSENSMTTEYTDTESYVSHIYPLTNRMSEGEEQMHKHMLMFCLSFLEEASQDRQTFHLQPIYWINIMQNRAFFSGKRQLINHVSQLFKKYPMAHSELTDLYKRMVSSRFSSRGRIIENNFDVEEEEEEFQISGQSEEERENSQQHSDYETNLIEAWEKPIPKSLVDEDEWRYMETSASDHAMAQIEKFISVFLREFMSDEDQPFRENNPETYCGTHDAIPLTLENSKDGNRFDVRTWKYEQDGITVVLGGKDNDLRYEKKYPLYLEKSRTSIAGKSFIDSHSLRDYVDDVLTSDNIRSELQEFKNIISVTAAAKKDSSFVPNNRLMGTNNHSDNPITSWTQLFEHCTTARNQLNSLIQELKHFIRNQVAKPADSILGEEGKANFIPFLFRGGFHEYFRFIGVADVLNNDNDAWHTYGTPTLFAQIMKVVTHRENDNVYNIWGSNLPIGSMLYLAAIRTRGGSIPQTGLIGDVWKKLRNSFNRRHEHETFSNLQNIEDSVYDHEEWWDTAFHGHSKKQTKIEFDCASLGSDVFERAVEDQGWVGWNDYGPFQLIPITWGNRHPDPADLKYVDIYGNECVAQPLFIGTMKYDFHAESTGYSYPWSALPLALGFPSENGMVPTLEICKIAMMKLPRIRVLVSYKT